MVIFKKKQEKEELIEEIKFKVHKFNNRERPSNKSDIVVFPSFSEFGSEIISIIYCIPHLLTTRYLGKYSIAMGWYGRKYLYEHLVDEFWELDESHQPLREHCLAFHHNSKNLHMLEKRASETGHVVHVDEYAIVCLYQKINSCIVSINEKVCNGEVEELPDSQKCRKCGTNYPGVGVYYDIIKAKSKAKWLPAPKIDFLPKLKPNSVGICARNRKRYGRNLPIEFYEKLICLLEDMGYNPIWFGEEQSTYACPFSRIPDFRGEKDLEKVLALMIQLQFTIQFWTASTRLAALSGIPFLLFESPGQIYDNGQEGIRLNICSRTPYKLVLSNFWNVFNDHTDGLRLVERAIREMEIGNYEEITGMVDSVKVVKHFKNENEKRVKFGQS